MAKMTHDEALDGIISAARIAGGLSYQEAIEGYLKLRDEPVQTMTEAEIDAECNRIMEMSPAEIDAYLRAQGDDPEKIVRKMDTLIKNSIEIVRLRRENEKLRRLLKAANTPEPPRTPRMRFAEQ